MLIVDLCAKTYILLKDYGGITLTLKEHPLKPGIVNVLPHLKQVAGTNSERKQGQTTQMLLSLPLVLMKKMKDEEDESLEYFAPRYIVIIAIHPSFWILKMLYLWQTVLLILKNPKVPHMIF